MSLFDEYPCIIRVESNPTEVTDRLKSLYEKIKNGTPQEKALAKWELNSEYGYFRPSLEIKEYDPALIETITKNGQEVVRKLRDFYSENTDSCPEGLKKMPVNSDGSEPLVFELKFEKAQE
uniref:Uncharacterized protein n=1 Tax=Rhizobium phage IG49 TaxID=3129228 RepID=A0AAU8HYM3_9CAUD